MAIDIKQLTEADKGRWVSYLGQEKGRIKGWNNSYIFVVYKCNEDWDNYQNYTAASTHPKSLDFIEE